MKGIRTAEWCKAPLRAGRLLFLLLFLTTTAAFAQVNGEINRQTLTYRDTLQLDFYSAEATTSNERPLIVLVHGGGFSGGTRDGIGETAFCREMAGSGYAVASISYRLTRKGASFGCDCPARDKIDTFVKASEDLADALRFLREQEQLVFDRNMILLAGSSAGAETVLNAAFMGDHYEFKHIGPLGAAGLISFAGAVLNSDYINEGNALPMLLFHGEKDELVPFGTSPHHYCAPETEGYLILDGSASITERLAAAEKSYILAFDPEGGHEWANEGYGHTELIIHFIEDLVRKGEFEQKKMQVEKRSRP